MKAFVTNQKNVYPPFFNKERANDPKYVAELEKEGISIKRWENLKGHDKDGFTVIDHRLKGMLHRTVAL